MQKQNNVRPVKVKQLLHEWLIFEVASQYYALEITQVKEITKTQPLTPVPGAPAYVKGIINLRGNIVTILDLPNRLGNKSNTLQPNNIIIVKYLEQWAGFLVDTAYDIVSIAETKIKSPENLNHVESNYFIKSIAQIGNKVVMLLDLEKVFATSSQSKMEQL